MNRPLALAGFLLALAALSPSLRAQSVAVAQVSGSVTDQTGAAIAGAQVTMTETDKAVARSTVTDCERLLRASQFASGAVLARGPRQRVQGLRADRHCSGG